MRDFFYPSAGAGQIHSRVWLPEGAPRGVLQIVHGIAEHIGRYQDFALFMAAKGYIVAAEDHMGHGGSISEACPIACFPGGWDAAVRDVHTLYDIMHSQYPDLSYFLLGHSMGSFLARSFLYSYSEAGLAGAVISGTGQQGAALVGAGRAICAIAGLFMGNGRQSPMLHGMMFGSYNRRFAGEDNKHPWLSSVKEVGERFKADPLCGFLPSIGLCAAMLKGINYIQKKKNLARMDKALPVLFFSGDMDPVGDYGEGFRKAVESFHNAGMSDVTPKLYPGGRHEMLNEACREDVYADMLAWMESKQ